VAGLMMSTMGVLGAAGALAAAAVLAEGWRSRGGWYVGSGVALLATTAVAAVWAMAWQEWGAALTAQLVLRGALPQGFARRRFRVALELLRLRGARGGELRLELEGCVADTDACAVAEALNDFLRSGACPRGALEVLALRRCTALSCEGLRQLVAAAFSPSSAGCKELDLRGCSLLGDCAAEALSALLMAEAHGLEDLTLAGCGLSAAGVSAFSQAVSGPPPVMLSSATDISAVSLAAALPGGSQAFSTSAPLAPPARQDLAGAAADAGAPVAPWTPLQLRRPTAPPAPPGAELGLRSLQLSFNALAGAGRALAAILRSMPELQMLSLEECGLQLEDVQQLARALPRSGLVQLDLAGNELRAKGLLAVAGGLRTSRIQDLGLERNEIGMGDALVELKAAHDKRPFPRLRLAGNRLTDAQQTAFLQTLNKGPGPARRFGKGYCPPGCDCFEGRGEVM